MLTSNCRLGKMKFKVGSLSGMGEGFYRLSEIWKGKKSWRKYQF